MSQVRLDGWSVVPRLAVVVPGRRDPGWRIAAFWCAVLDAWGIPSERVSPAEMRSDMWTTVVAPASIVDASLAEDLISIADQGTVLLCGPASEQARRLATLSGVVDLDVSADDLDPSTSERIVDLAEQTLALAARGGMVGIWRWPDEKDAALVVDGDVDHPTGVDPECARYVAPAIETAGRAGYSAYGVFAAAANIDAEPASFPPGVDYYNHSYSHPYSHWNAEPWESLSSSQMERELRRSDKAFHRHFGRGDQGLFRLPHFQLASSDRTYDVLEQLRYRAESSIGGNVSVTGGLPFHPAREAWSERETDAAYARTDPDPGRVRPFLQLPISTDPSDTGFRHGCCSYNTLGEGVRNRTADPEAYEALLQQVVDRAVERRSLAHLFIDPPDAGYGRLPGDHPNYANAVERWLRRAVERDDIAIMSTAELTTWWLGREQLVERLSLRIEDGHLIVEVDDPPNGAALVVRPPGTDAAWCRVPIPEGPT